MSSKASSSAATYGKDKMSSPEQEPISISSLPYDLLLNCLALVSRLDYPTLSLVSKKFRSIIVSSELYEARSRINRTEKCLYLCLHFSFQRTKPYALWFTLCRKPNRTLTNKLFDYLMFQIPSPKYLLPGELSSLIAVGSNIYDIGGSNHGSPYSSSVSVLDCRSHMWHQAPSMSMKRGFCSTTSLVDGKIYVSGGCEDRIASNWIEAFDITTQTWKNVTNPHVLNEFKPSCLATSFESEGKVYMCGYNKIMVYNAREDRWNDATGVDWVISCLEGDDYCRVDDVLFFCDQGVLKWYDFKVSLWKEVKGVEAFRNYGHGNIVDLGGKVAVLWTESANIRYRNIFETWVYCAEVALERRDGNEIWGKVEWIDCVLIIPEPFSFDIVALSASV